MQAYGVYEGSYWELLANLNELSDILKRMSFAPKLLEEPVLILPEQPELPKWEEYKPVQLAAPGPPEVKP